VSEIEMERYTYSVSGILERKRGKVIIFGMATRVNQTPLI
jgi:hypothetical protein